MMKVVFEQWSEENDTQIWVWQSMKVCVLHRLLFAAAPLLPAGENIRDYRSMRDGWGFGSGSRDHQMAWSQLPPVHSTETNLCEINVKELREFSPETLVKEPEPFTCTSISQLFITPDARCLPICCQSISYRCSLSTISARPTLTSNATFIIIPSPRSSVLSI